MPDINQEFEREHLRNLGEYQNQVTALYYATIDNVFRASVGITITKPEFRVTDYPSLNNALLRALSAFLEQLPVILSNGIKAEFDMSDRKNARLFEQKYGKPAPSSYYNPNQQAFSDFVARRTGPKRLNLSDRVWKLHHQFQAMIEQSLYVGIAEGKPAAKMAAEAKRFLREPDRLFRRVRDAKGKLVLSRPAKLYKPGQGVYRSSYKNALRLTAHETNAAYRSSDHERWKNSKMILGIEVKLSRSHPKFDICDHLVGVFPKDYKHTGFHVRCLCFAVPLLADKEQYSQYEDAILAGQEESFKFTGYVKEIHPKAKQWILDNAEKIEGAKSKPLFLQDNPRLLKKVLAE